MLIELLFCSLHIHQGKHLCKCKLFKVSEDAVELKADCEARSPQRSPESSGTTQIHRLLQSRLILE